MQRPKVAPPGARLPLVILALALAAGAVMFLGVHLVADAAAPHGPRSLVARPGSVSAGAHEHAAP